MIPLKNKEFMKFTAIILTFHLAWFISMTFAQLYEIKYMEISYTYLTLMGSIGAVVQVLIYPLWGRVTDKYGPKLIMRIAMFFFMIHAGIYIFMVRDNAYILLIILCLNGAVLSPAWTLSTFNERFSSIPAEGRTIYDSFFTAANGIVIMMAPIIGNILRKTIINSNINFMLYQEFKILFIISFIALATINIVLLSGSYKNTGLKMERLMVGNIKNRLLR